MFKRISILFIAIAVITAPVFMAAGNAQQQGARRSAAPNKEAGIAAVDVKKLLENQEAILKKLNEMDAKLDVIRVRASR